MRRRYLLLGILALAGATGCANRPIRSGHCCVGSIFPGRPLLARPMLSAPVGSTPMGSAPIGYGAPVGFDGGVGAPGCSSCGGGAGGMTGMPIASTGGYPHGFQASMHAPTYGNAIPHDSMLLPSPTVVPPGFGSPRIDVDPPKPMPMMAK